MRIPRDVTIAWAAYSEGIELQRDTLPLPAAALSGGISNFEWRDRDGLPGPIFAELEITAAEPCFASRMPLPNYAIAWRIGGKSILASTAYKYGSPQIIEMMSAFGSFVEAFPAVHIDRERDFGQSVALINPYLKPIVVDILTHDGRTLPRIRVPARSVRYCQLAAILHPNETRWLGQIQMTATNRIVAYMYKHSLSDPTQISDQEHMDPYRSDPTHFPLTQQWRLRFGDARRRWQVRRRTPAP
jgi:hypothetical protein